MNKKKQGEHATREEKRAHKENKQLKKRNKTHKENKQLKKRKKKQTQGEQTTKEEKKDKQGEHYKQIKNSVKTVVVGIKTTEI